MNEYIYPLSDEALTLANSGGKGKNLQQLVAAGFPVPPGFVVSTAAYDAFVSSNKLQSRIVELSQQTVTGDMASFTEASQAIRALFDDAHLTGDISESIWQAYGALAGPVAVRSSATAEDLPEASFAGQQESFLNIHGRDALLDAVRKCWSSLWTARAMAYRGQQNIQPTEVKLAVVVQQMVAATAAGVLFTVNPVSGEKSEMMVNATWGLGEALVSGQVSPDSMILDKTSGRIKQVTTGDKAVMTTAANSGTADIAVPAEKRMQQVVNAEQAAELARLGREIEAHFGHPQDIEWAIAGNQVTILQSRPVTVAGGVPGDDAWPPFDQPSNHPYDLWTQADLGERWPEPITPFTWSTWYTITQENMLVSFEGAADQQLRSIQWMKRAYGRAYLNEGAIGFGLNHAYGMPASFGEASYAAPHLIPPVLNRYRWGRLLRRLPLLIKMARTWVKNAAYFESQFAQIDSWVEEFLERDLTGLSDRQLWHEAQGLWYERIMEYITYHANVTSMVTTAYGQIETQVARKLGGKEFTQTLTSGISDIIAAEIVPMLWEMARTVDELGLREFVLDNDPAEALAQLRQMTAAEPLMALFDRFLQRHGHRCMSEAEYRYPRWREAPEQVMVSISNYLQMDGQQFDPAANEARQQRKRQEATRQMEAKLNPVSKLVFGRALDRLHRLMRLRDNGQHFLVKLIMPQRVLFAELARRWAEQGWLNSADDFYFLVVPEIEQVLEAGQSPEVDLEAFASRRRQAYEYWFTQPFPEVLDAQGNPVETSAGSDSSMLTGIAASQGEISGIARVIHTPQEAASILPGEILVTRATDPGWTPIFSVIGGLVLEVGGQLSHGAIVAREYGLPAVVNVAGATQIIQNSDVITVDGRNGRVHLEKKEGRDEHNMIMQESEE